MRRRPRTRRGAGAPRGYTTIELLVAVMLSLIVALAAGAIVLTNNESFRQGQRKLGLQQEATRSVEQIARDVRRSRWIQWSSGNAKRIALYDHFGNPIRVYDRGAVGGQNRALQDGAPLTAFECTQLTFAINADTTTVDITLELRNPAENANDRVKVESRASIRNRPYVLVDPLNPNP